MAVLNYSKATYLFKDLLSYAFPFKFLTKKKSVYTSICMFTSVSNYTAISQCVHLYYIVTSITSIKLRSLFKCTHPCVQYEMARLVKFLIVFMDPSLY